MITEQELLNIKKGDALHFVSGGSATVESVEFTPNGVKLVASGSSLLYSSTGICRHASLLNIAKVVQVYYAIVLDENSIPQSVSRIAATAEDAEEERAFMQRVMPGCNVILTKEI